MILTDSRMLYDMAVILYVLSLFLFLIPVFLSLRRSEFGILIAVNEIFYLIPVCIYPILFFYGLVSPGEEGSSFLSNNKSPGVITALHILLWGLGGAIGYLVGAQNNSNFVKKFICLSNMLYGNESFFAKKLLLSGFILYALYFLLIGWDVALINAAAARSGIFDEFGEGAKYLFLKTLASVSLCTVCFLPQILKENKYTLFIFYIFFVIICYLNSFSRGLFLTYLIMPVLIVFHCKGFSFKRTIFSVFVILPFALLVLLYGKSLGSYLGNFFSGNTLPDLISYEGDAGLINTIFRNLEYRWFSVTAGLNHFYNTGTPLVPKDIIYSLFFGFIPSRLLDMLSLGFLYYGDANTRLSCINTTMFGIDNCTIPPGPLGYSAYFLPLVGGLFFGFFRMYVYGKIDILWRYFRDIDYSKIWLPYLCFIMFSSLISLIPNRISYSVFVIIAGFFYYNSIKMISWFKGQIKLAKK